MRALNFKTQCRETMRQECRFFGADAGFGAGCGAGSFPPMCRHVPEWARGFILGLFAGHADIAQEVVIKAGEAAALAEQSPDLCETVQEPQAAGGAGGRCGEGAVHGGGLHMML